MRADQLLEEPSHLTRRRAKAQIGGQVDNRPVAVAQRQLQASLNHSPRVQQQAFLEQHIQNSLSPATPLQSPTAPLQRQPNNTGLPDGLKAGVESLSGYSLDDVRVHYNSAQPAQLQAHAYAQGTDIHVAPGQEQHLPHEAWHVVQQKQGRVKPTMQLKGTVAVNDDAGLEKEADVMGTKALAPVARLAGGPEQKKQLPHGQSGPVQRYTIIRDLDGAKLSKDKDMLVHAKQLYAPVTKVQASNVLLAQAGPFGALIRLNNTGNAITVEEAPGVAFQAVVPVVDEESKRRRLEATPTSHHAAMTNPELGKLEIWADCGRASEVVTGSSPGTLGNDRKVKIGGQFVTPQSGGYTGELDLDAKNDSKTARLSMAVYTEAIFPFIDRYGIEVLSEELLKKYFLDMQDLTGEDLYEAKYEKLRLASTSIDTAEKLYSSLMPEAKVKFHEFTGTNEYANPDVGDAYSTVTEYGMPGFQESGNDWAFHWGGVVMKDSADNVTLENLSVSNPGIRNTNWYFAMYGTESKEQTFHAQQTRPGGHHGSIGTTINVTTSKAHPKQKEVYQNNHKKILALKKEAEPVYKANQGIWAVSTLYSYFDSILALFAKEFHNTGAVRSWHLQAAQNTLRDMYLVIKEEENK